MSGAQRDAERETNTAGRQRARAALSEDKAAAIRLEDVVQHRTARPSLDKVAARAGQLSLDAERVTPAQVANRERNATSALLALPLMSGGFLADELARALERAEPGTAEHAAAVAAIEAHMDAETPTLEVRNARLRAVAEATDASIPLHACASCGVRSLPSTAAEFQRLRLDDARFVALRYSADEARRFGAMNANEQRVRNSFLSPHDGQRYHLVPELVSAAAAAKAAAAAAAAPLGGGAGGSGGAAGAVAPPSAVLCGRCATSAQRGAVPQLSIASGLHYGHLARALPDDMRPSRVEWTAVALNRNYMQVFQLTTSGGRSSATGGMAAMRGHAISFAHNGPAVANAAAAAARLRRRAGVQPVLARSIVESVHLVLVAPQRYLPLLRLTFRHSRGFTVRAEVVRDAHSLCRSRHGRARRAGPRARRAAAVGVFV
jgi:hypothetical protein